MAKVPYDPKVETLDKAGVLKKEDLTEDQKEGIKDQLDDDDVNELIKIKEKLGKTANAIPSRPRAWFL